MSLGIKIHCSYPLSLEGAYMPSAFVSLSTYFMECKISPSPEPTFSIINRKDQEILEADLLNYLKSQIRLSTHDLEIYLKNAGTDRQKTLHAVQAVIHYANHFFTRKYHKAPLDLENAGSNFQDLFHSGKFSFVSGQKVFQLPNPSGLAYALFSPAKKIEKQAARDENAFLLSEGTYKMNYKALEQISVPKEIKDQFYLDSAQYLTLIPLFETQNILAVFLNSVQRDRFIKVFKKNYICLTELDYDGILVI